MSSIPQSIPTPQGESPTEPKTIIGQVRHLSLCNLEIFLAPAITDSGYRMSVKIFERIVYKGIVTAPSEDVAFQAALGLALVELQLAIDAINKYVATCAEGGAE